MLTAEETDQVLGLAAVEKPTRRGGNSTITRVSWQGRDLAVKDYSARLDAQDRMRRETRGLQFLEQAGLRNFPRWVGASPGRGTAVFTWVPGEPPSADSQAVAAMTDVLRRLHEASALGEAHTVEMAADAMVSLSDIVDQVRHRCSSLSASRIEQVSSFASELSSNLGRLSHESGPSGRCSTLSLSDFGCHNMLLDVGSGDYVFLDLEFFGWDDAHKLVVDTLLHPLSSWSDDLANEFLDACRDIYTLDELRLHELTALLSSKWAAIVAARAEREGLAGDLVACERSIARAQAYLGLALGSERAGWLPEIWDGGER